MRPNHARILDRPRSMPAGVRNDPLQLHVGSMYPNRRLRVRGLRVHERSVFAQVPCAVCKSHSVFPGFFRSMKPASAASGPLAVDSAAALALFGQSAAAVATGSAATARALATATPMAAAEPLAAGATAAETLACGAMSSATAPQFTHPGRGCLRVRVTEAPSGQRHGFLHAR